MSNNGLVWSNFVIRVLSKNDFVFLKSALSGAVVSIGLDTERNINTWLKNQDATAPEEVESLSDASIGLIIPAGYDECTAWRKRFVDRRNNAAHMFILHFLPTIQCQLECRYCIENGGDRGVGMRPEILGQSRKWLLNYLSEHPEIDTFRLVLFGGEPLLRKDIVKSGVEGFHFISLEKKLSFWIELVSNGELLDEQIAEFLSKHEWRRVQITLDGPEKVHDARRHGKNYRPTFRKVMKNIKMLLDSDFIEKVDIRMSIDSENADSLPNLIRCLADLKKQDRINLSIGVITPTLADMTKFGNEEFIAEKALVGWTVAKECGFGVPKEFITGPWCVAIAKHSAILQPDGSLQKCFCTSGRKEYDFGTIYEEPGEYLRDARFEHFRRTDQCIKEKCQFLPMCGGGCIHDAVVENGGADGFDRRYCQKSLLEKMNHGLLRLNY